MGMFGLLAALASLFARPIRPSGAPDSSQKTRFVPTHARFVTFFGMTLEMLSRKGIKRRKDLASPISHPASISEDAHVS